MNVDQIEAYLAHLVLELRKRGVSDRRFVEEARGHLIDAVEQGIERGLEATVAQQEAITQFGRAESVVRIFVSDKYRLFDLMVLLAAVFTGLAIAYVDSSPNWDETGMTAFFLVMAAAMCAFIAPRQPWKWALAVGLWIPFLAIVQSGSSQSLAMLLVLLFPFVGAYGAAPLRRRLTLAWSAESPEKAGHFHDKNRFHFAVMLKQTKHGHIDPVLAAIMEDPGTHLIPFLERLTPGPLGSLGPPESVTDESESTNARVRKYRVVFGGVRKIICNIEIGGGRKVSVHWSRTH